MTPTKTKQKQTTKLTKNPQISAQKAGLHYITDTIPGITRRLSQNGYVYTFPNGQQITNQNHIDAINKLRIPPAYKNVWISPLTDGHIQATGIDALGRKQYRYHPAWREYRSSINHHRMIEFGKLLPQIRRNIEKDLQESAMNRKKVLATVVKLLDITLIRVGNEDYAKENGTFGLTTMQKNHVALKPIKDFIFEFEGKSHKDHIIHVSSKKLFQIVAKCMELPGYEVFKYQDDKGNLHDVNSSDVNQYLKEISGQEISAKDFRTWWSSVLALMALEKCEITEKESQLKKNIVSAVKYASSKLGNTPAV